MLGAAKIGNPLCLLHGQRNQLFDRGENGLCRHNKQYRRYRYQLQAGIFRWSKETKTFTLLKPVKLGGEEVYELTLCEPTAGQIAAGPDRHCVK
jgi:hypothetical protein